jgi:hypothetical protein
MADSIFGGWQFIKGYFSKIHKINDYQEFVTVFFSAVAVL